jgi:hypothetical protein
MRPHPITRHTAIRLILGSTLGTLLLPACSEWQGSDSSSSSRLAGEWVDVEALFKEPQKFVDRGRIRFYLTAVSGNGGAVKESSGHLRIHSSDTRQVSSVMLDILLIPSAARRWESAQLGSGFEFTYGVTFSGHLKSVDQELPAWYNFLVDGFEINDETNYLQDLDRRKSQKEYRPTQVLALPRPLTIKDSKRLSLLATDYIGRKVRFDLGFSDDDLQVSKSGKPYILTDDLALMLNEELVRELLGKPESFSRARVIGEVLKERDEAGRLQIAVDSLELLS